MELKGSLKFIFSQFKTKNCFKDFKAFNTGHINDTFLIITDTKPYYVLQKINANVFIKAKEIINNKIKITNHLSNKNIKTLQYIVTKNNENSFKDIDDNYWILCLYIENSETYLKVTSNKIAFEAGKTTGNFLLNINDFSDTLKVVLPNFHNMTFRFSNFFEALKTASEERKIQAKAWIDFAISKQEEMLILDKAINTNKIPLRVTHNDTKISNILFDKNQKAICLIDLDTVMLGVIHFDYGDAIRTICNTADEDEKDSSKINFNLEYFKKYTKGFIKNLKNNISNSEFEYLPISPKIMTFIMGIRFLTDYLNNNIYYKVNYKEHNLDRAKNQFTLVKKIEKSQQKITDFIFSFDS